MPALNCRLYGDPAAPAVVLIHGLFGSAANWGSIARRLADRHYVLNPDLRNHGQSPHDPVHDYPGMAADLRHLLDTHGIDHATLIGHSMGGKAAMQLALETPDRVERLVVVDIAPVDYAHDFQDVLDAFDAVDLSVTSSRADAERQMANRLDSPGLRAFLLQNLVRDGGAWCWRFNREALADAQDVITGFPEAGPGVAYTGPTLFLHGSESDYVLPAHQTTIRTLFPTATIVPIADAGHWVYADQPAAFLARLEGFLDA